ncbi:unnamed protein product [Rangifer tarandus platyrhynchus]|uniref:Uncharacterized protein n=1 Tax=Rangifer tarandus platyrhynchus TaxID=3082113 RepID=A0ABN8ZFE3_RANTA|nr:unnamed protein product [Rangifer tarandus platyrhynchus]
MCTEKPSAGVSGRGLAARDEGLGCPGDSGTWGALEWRLWLPQTPPHQAAGARHQASQGRPPFLTPSPHPKEEPVTLRPVSGSMGRHRCAGPLWADALRVSTVLPSREPGGQRPDPTATLRKPARVLSPPSCWRCGPALGGHRCSQTAEPRPPGSSICSPQGPSGTFALLLTLQFISFPTNFQ